MGGLKGLPDSESLPDSNYVEGLPDAQGLEVEIDSMDNYINRVQERKRIIASEIIS